MTLNFFLSQVILVSIYYIVAFSGGNIVKKYGVKANYTRKINHFSLFFLPMFLSTWLPFKPDLYTLTISIFVGLISLSVYVYPIRNRINIVAVAFSSFDRPEDRPHTLLWLTTQIAVTAIVSLPILIYLHSIDKMILFYIPVLINGIGDGLAEPVGVRFGKHTYKTKALFGHKEYVRSLEGSLCVFIVSIGVIFLLSSHFSSSQFAGAIILIPLLMTLAEAKSPHTWDSPFLYGVSGILIALILLI